MTMPGGALKLIAISSCRSRGLWKMSNRMTDDESSTTVRRSAHDLHRSRITEEAMDHLDGTRKKGGGTRRDETKSLIFGSGRAYNFGLVI